MFHRTNMDRPFYSRSGAFSPTPSGGDGIGSSKVSRKSAKGRQIKSSSHQVAHGDYRQARYQRTTYIKRPLGSISDESLESEPQDVIDLCPREVPRYRRVSASVKYRPNPRLYPGPAASSVKRAPGRSTAHPRRRRRRRRRACLLPNPRLYRPPAPRPPPSPAPPRSPPPLPQAARALWPSAPSAHALRTASSVALRLTAERHTPDRRKPAQARLVGGVGSVESRCSGAMSAPSEFLAEFLTAIMQRKYSDALDYCRLILQYEPENATARGFYPLLQYKLQKKKGNAEVVNELTDHLVLNNSRPPMDICNIGGISDALPTFLREGENRREEKEKKEGDVSQRESGGAAMAAAAAAAAGPASTTGGHVTTEVFMPPHRMHASSSSSSLSRSPSPSLSPPPSPSPPSARAGSSSPLSSELSLSDTESEGSTQGRTSFSSGSGSGSRWGSCGSSPRDDNGNTTQLAALRISGDSDENDNQTVGDVTSRTVHDNYNAQESSETESWSSLRALRARVAAAAASK